MYKAANPAGQAIDFAGKDAMYGEVYFLRAYYYFTLVRMFGDVPLFIDKRLSLTDSKSLTRAPKAEVYAQIEKDLNAAIAVLPPTQAMKGKSNQICRAGLIGQGLSVRRKIYRSSRSTGECDHP
jgi:ribonuclease HII